MRQAEEPVVQRGHVAADDEADDAGVVELVAPFGDSGAMVAEGMVGSAHAEAQGGAGEEAGKGEHVGAAGRRIARRYDAVQGQPGRREGDGAEQVRPDVDRLVVQGPDGPERGSIAVAVGPVPRADELVVAPPVRQVVPEHEQGSPNLGLDLARCRRHSPGDPGGATSLPNVVGAGRPGRPGRGYRSHGGQERGDEELGRRSRRPSVWLYKSGMSDSGPVHIGKKP